jgi:hypothetical protein
MIKWLVIFAMMVIVLGVALDVYACEVYTILNPDGTYKSCVICGTLISCS